MGCGASSPKNTDFVDPGTGGGASPTTAMAAATAATAAPAAAKVSAAAADAGAAPAASSATPLVDAAVATAGRPETGATINIAYLCPKEKADEVQAVFSKHSAWMQTFYAGSIEFLISCYFTKAPQFKVPTDPSQGETDDVIFTINEEFADQAAVARHVENAMKNDYFPEFGKVMEDYGKVVQTLGAIYFKLDASRAKGERPATGATINIYYVCPKAKADEVQAVFGKHSAHMAKYYAGSTEHLISCYFTKAPLFKVPTEPSQGETDDVIFTINEEFADQAAVARHIETAKGNDYFPEFGKVMGDYGKVVQPLGEIYFKIR